MSTVTLREIFSGFANLPNGWRVLGEGVEPKPANQDDGTGRDMVVELPAGYHVAMSGAGVPEIYNAAQQFCEVKPGPRREGDPRLADLALGYRTVALKVVEYRDDERARELVAELAHLDDGTDNLGVTIRQALSDNPAATVRDVAEIVREARAEHDANIAHED